MKLSSLLCGAGFSPLPSPLDDPEILDIACDSRKVKPGTLFIALPGSVVDGYDYIPAALKAGASAVVAQRPADIGDVPLIVFEEPRTAMAQLADAFYGHSSEKLTIIGVTGTKGKTTTTHILKAMLEAAGCKTAMVGTVGFFIGEKKLSDSLNTTPESLELHRFFSKAVEEGCTHAVMEVSSQALKLHRTTGLNFDVALFLNLSPDHIGGAEHKDFEEYLSCKAMLFSQCKQAAGNVDDEHFTQIFERCMVPVKTFGASDAADVKLSDISLLSGQGLLGSQFKVSGYEEPLQLNLPGKFNVLDALAALTVAGILGIPESAQREGLLKVTVRGRTELYSHPGGTIVMIDYAHNDVSFASILSTLKQYDHDRLIVVFGAGGDRPKMRRTDMAREAANYADFAVITMDNPRTERVEDICADITAGLGGKIPSIEIYDRAEAIRYALDMAGENDIVALLGKGHEEYIEINGVRSHFSEREVLDEYYANQK